jgi:hypothetical protein
MFKKMFVNEKIKCDTCKQFEKENSDAKITYKKNKSGDTIVYVNGQTAYNLDDNYTEEQALNALERAYKSSLKEGIDSVDILARELAKEKKNLSDAMYKKLHKIMMKNDPKEADKALAELQKIKKTKSTYNEGQNKLEIRDLEGSPIVVDLTTKAINWLQDYSYVTGKNGNYSMYWKDFRKLLDFDPKMKNNFVKAL